MCFLYLRHKQYDTFLRHSHYFLYIHDRWITFFMKALKCYLTAHYINQLIFCIRNKVNGLATTLRSGRSGHLVLVQERVSFHLQNNNAAFWANTPSLTMGARVPSWCVGLNLTSYFHFVGWQKVSVATLLPSKTKIPHMANMIKNCYIW